MNREHPLCLSLNSVLHGALQVATKLRFMRFIIQLLVRAGCLWRLMPFVVDINCHFNPVELNIRGGFPFRGCSGMSLPRTANNGEAAGASTTVSAKTRDQRE
jgi:hypothetical protein